MAEGRGKWRRYRASEGIPCDPTAYVDVCENDDVYIDIPAHQAFDERITHWRPSIDDVTRAALHGGEGRS